MPPRTTRPRITRQVRIDHRSAVHLAVRAAREAAEEAGLPGALPEKAAVLASELATNLHKHAVDGVLYVQPLPLGHGVEVVAADRGPGIGSVDAALTDGFTTSGTLGTGLGAIRRIATDLSIRTDPTGTLVAARLTVPGAAPGSAGAVGTVCLPVGPQEQGARHEDLACGDAAAVVETEAGRTAVLIDALGHGPAAAEAAGSAMTAFLADPGAPLSPLMTALHSALRRTRGAAVALLRNAGGTMEFCATGNVRLVLADGQRARGGPQGPPGIVGYNLPRPVVHRLPATAAGVWVLHTDGIDAAWSRDPAPFLLRLPPSLLAPALAHRHRHARDDAAAIALAP
ncbi:ATP-binding protein [Streptomyces marincola]|uniref:ATP-binding protein n=1 Tax=Streptomyces marincola TaxID=2878388 RepID=UPI000A343AC6|nr:ATP-binding protein [Streptomyces marincola]